jgi:hypothetical protein
MDLRLVRAARMVVAGWKAGRINPDDAGEDVPEGDRALGELADALAAADAAPLPPRTDPLFRVDL